MKILMINKFLHPNGGSETYMFKLGKHLQSHGHDIQYFGMEHEGRCVGNNVNAYTSNMDFRSASLPTKLIYSFKTIYSMEARRKLRLILDDFRPDICHLNNFNYQLTPSILLEIVHWRNSVGKKCRIIYTAHDYQLICPNHMMNVPATHENCESCLGGHFFNCVKKRCIHESFLKSLTGTAEAVIWNHKGVYQYIDRIICCSSFMKKKMDSNPIFRDKTVVFRNFVEKGIDLKTEKKDYVLYFGRFSWEKGIRTLIDACKQLLNIPFIVAGNGSYDKELDILPNVTDVGFKSGVELERIVREAKFSVCPSECYENCPFSVMESQSLGTPVLGANIGGIPELVSEDFTGRLFESGNANDLARVIQEMYSNDKALERYAENCRKLKRDSLDEYCTKLMGLYQDCSS